MSVFVCVCVWPNLRSALRNTGAAHSSTRLKNTIQVGRASFRLTLSLAPKLTLVLSLAGDMYTKIEMRLSRHTLATMN